MSDSEPKPTPQSDYNREDGEPQDDAPSQGPNLVVIYSLIAFALMAAIFLAGMIVLPFYRRR